VLILVVIGAAIVELARGPDLRADVTALSNICKESSSIYGNFTIL
jgi:hypothetical protein